MSIASQINETFTKKLEQYTKEYDVTFKDVQFLLLKRAESPAPEIVLYVNNKKERILDIQEDILSLKIDFLGEAAKTAMLLDIIMGALSSELSCTKEEVQIQLVARSLEDPSVCLALYKNNTFIRWIDLEGELDF